MDTKILLLFTALASTAALAQGTRPPAPPSDPYTDKDSGFVFPPAVGSFQRTGISHLKDPALWVDYRDSSSGAKVRIRIILRQRMAGPKGILSCREDMDWERSRMQRLPKSIVAFSEPRRPEFAGYASASLRERFGKSGHVEVTDFYAYCPQATPRIVLYGFMHPNSADAGAQEIAFIRSVKPPG